MPAGARCTKIEQRKDIYVYSIHVYPGPPQVSEGICIVKLSAQLTVVYIDITVLTSYISGSGSDP